MDNFALLMNVLYHFAEHYEDRFILREILDKVDQYCDEDDHKKFDNDDKDEDKKHVFFR